MHDRVSRESDHNFRDTSHGSMSDMKVAIFAVSDQWRDDKVNQFLWEEAAQDREGLGSKLSGRLLVVLELLKG